MFYQSFLLSSGTAQIYLGHGRLNKNGVAEMLMFCYWCFSSPFTGGFKSLEVEAFVL